MNKPAFYDIFITYRDKKDFLKGEKVERLTDVIQYNFTEGFLFLVVCSDGILSSTYTRAISLSSIEEFEASERDEE